jgi:hypothetical protein
VEPSEDEPSGRLIDFAVMQQLALGEAWDDVVRYDCHGSFHVHRFTRGGLETKTQLGDLSNLDAKFVRAVMEVLRDWEENLQRYLDG